MLKELCRAGIEGMTDMPGSTQRNKVYGDLIGTIIAFIIALIIVAFVGKWLWNSSMPMLFTVARPITSVWQLIALMLLISIVL
jgi:hypothetical protein